MATAPACLAVTTPEMESMVAKNGWPELHRPPDAEATNVGIAPKQTDPGPLIVPGSGSGLTVTTADTEFDPQLGVEMVYATVAVSARYPVIRPLLSILTTAVSNDHQNPPPLVSDNIWEASKHTARDPEIAVGVSGSGLIVTINVAGLEMQWGA